jgi:hypothetical protein
MQGASNHVIGSEVALVGRVGSDALADLLVGEWYDSGASQGGAIYLAGDKAWVANTQTTVSGPEYNSTTPFDYVGDSLSGQVDVDQDGHDDVLVGRKNAQESENLAYLLFGGDTMPASGTIDDRSSIRFTASSDGTDECPCAVQGIGDMDGDGLDDFAIGVSRNNSQAIDAGKVYVFHGRSSRAAWGLDGATTQVDIPLDDADLMVVGELSDDQAGAALAAADLNGDGLSDLVIGAPRWDGSSTTNAGRVYVIFGATPGKNPGP